MNIKQKKIKKIESTLKEIYKRYKNKGALSIYLWGSILTGDYNPKSSDIDSIAIVDKNAKLKDNEEINYNYSILICSFSFPLSSALPP